MKKKVVLLYIMDALRADHLGCYGYPRPTSPCLDRLAESAVVFDEVYSQSTETKTSAATLLTSTYASVHGTVTHRDRLPGGLMTLGECFQRRGFATAAFSTTPLVSAQYGFDRGFDCLSALHADPGFPDLASLLCSERITQRLMEWLQQVPQDKVFILAWAVDTHAPYVAPDEFVTRFLARPDASRDGSIKAILAARTEAQFRALVDLYDAEICHNDSQIGQIASALQALGLWEDAAVLVTGDHGEMFMEHGHFMMHGGAPYQEVVHVPVILKAPSLRAERNPRPGGLIDVMPTLLDLAEIPVPETCQGRSLFQAPLVPHVFSESFRGEQLASTAVYDKEWKLIRTTGLLRSSLLKKALRFRTPHKNVEAIQVQSDQARRERLSRRTIALALIRKYRTDFMGMPPVRVPGGCVMQAAGSRWRHFMGRERYELFDRKNDPAEQRNVIDSDSDRVRQLKQVLCEFGKRNTVLRENLSLVHESEAANRDMEERLRQLGYIE